MKDEVKATLALSSEKNGNTWMKTRKPNKRWTEPPPASVQHFT